MDVPREELERVAEDIDSMQDLGDRNHEYFEENRQYLCEEFPGEIVVIIGGDFGGSLDPDYSPEEFEDLMDKLEEEYGEKEVRESLCKRIQDPDELYIPSVGV